MISSSKKINTKLLDYMGLLVHYFRKRRVWGGSIGIRQVSLLEAYNSVVVRVLGQTDGRNE